MIRIAAIADVHFAVHSAGTLAPLVSPLNDEADIFLIAGDLTRIGDSDEARALATDLDVVAIPKVAIFGNHDYHENEQESIRTAMEDHGVVMLDGESVTIDLNGVAVGIAGIKGFGGGFRGACAADFGEPEMKNLVATANEAAGKLGSALAELDTDVRIALIHYSPIEATCRGERLEIYPFLGSYLLEEAVEEGRADVVFHGHAHNGSPFAHTGSGIPVYNVASTVIKSAYALVELETRQPGSLEGKYGVASR